MNLDDDVDSVFEQALRADLPSMSEQHRLRQRILAAGLAAGTALGSANVAASAPASFGASVLSKLSALSWPAKLGLSAALAAPVAVAALPLGVAPVRGAEIVNQVRSSAAAVRAKSAARTPPAPAQGGPTQASPSEPTPPPSTPGAADVLAQAPAPSPSPSALTARGLAASANQAASVDSAAAESGVAAFGALAHPTASSESLPPRNESTLAAETQLLDRAFAALAAGDRSTASALVAEHARRFPNGLLRQERERARNRLAQNPKGE